MAQAEIIQQIYDLITKGSEAGLVRLAEKATKASTAIEKSVGSTKRAGRELEGLKKLASAGALGLGLLVSGLTYSVKAAVDFQSAFAGVRKVLPDESDFKGIELGLRAMSREIPTSASELAALAESAGQLGIRGKENILGFTRTMADLANATNIVGQEGATSFARFVGLLPEAQQRYQNLGSSIVALGNSSKTTESEILTLGQRLVGAGVAAGLTGPQVLGLSAAMSSAGIEAEAGGTAMSTFLNSLKKASIEGGAELQKFATVAGVSAESFQKTFKEDAAGALQLFIDGLVRLEKNGGSASAALESVGVSGARGQAVFQLLAGAMSSTGEAGRLVAESMERSTKAFEENNALTEEATKRYGTAASQVKLLWNSVQDLAITVGSALLPAFTELVKVARFLVENLTVIGPAIAAAFAVANITTFITAINNARTAYKGFQDAVALQQALQAMSAFSARAVEAKGAMSSLGVATGAFGSATAGAASGVAGLGTKLGALAAFLTTKVTWAGFLGVITSGFAAAKIQILAAGGALKAFALSNPITAVAMAVGVLVTALSELDSVQNLVGASQKDFDKFVKETNADLEAQDRRMTAYSESLKAAGLSFPQLRGELEKFVRAGEDLADFQTRLNVLQRASEGGSELATRALAAYRHELQDAGAGARAAAAAAQKLADEVEHLKNITANTRLDMLKNLGLAIDPAQKKELEAQAKGFVQAYVDAMKTAGNDTKLKNELLAKFLPQGKDLSRSLGISGVGEEWRKVISGEIVPGAQIAEAAIKKDEAAVARLGNAAQEAAQKLKSFQQGLGLLSAADINETVGLASQTLATLAARGISTGPIVDKLNAVLRDAGDQAAAAGVSIDAKLVPAVERGTIAFYNAAAAAGEYGPSIELASKGAQEQLEAMKKSWADWESGALDAAAAAGQYGPSVDLMSDASKAAQSSLESLRAELGIGEAALNNYTANASALTTALADINEIKDPAERLKAFQALGPKMEALAESARRLGKTVPVEVAKAMNTEHVLAFGQAVQDTLLGVAQGALSLKQGLAQIGKGLLSDLLSGLKGGKSLFTGALSKLFGGEGEAGLFGKLGESLKGALSKGLGGFLASSGSLGLRLGVGLGGAAGVGIEKGLGSLAGKVAGGLGTALSAAAPIIGPIAGQLIGKVFGGLFGGTPTWKKVQGDVRKHLGVSISQGTAEAIADVKSKLHVGRDVAELLSLDKIAQEADLSSANVGKFAGEFLKLGQLARSGGKGAKEALEALGPSFATLTDKMRAAGLEGTEAFGAMVAGAKAFIGQSAEVTAFFEQGISSAAEGAKELIDLLGDVSAGFEGMGSDGQNAAIITKDVFNAMLALPGGALKALDALGGSVDSLAEKYKKLGLALPPEVADLISLKDRYKNVEPMLRQIDALTKITKGLGETGFISAQGFKALQDQTNGIAASMQNLGLSQEETLKALAPQLQQLVNEANRNHQEVDATTQGLIEQAASLGLVKLAGTDAYAAMRESNNYLLGGIAAIFGKEGAFQSYLAQTGTAAQTTFTGMQASFAGAAAGMTQTWQQTTGSVVDQSNTAATLVEVGWTKLADQVAAKQTDAAAQLSQGLSQTTTTLLASADAQTTGVLQKIAGWSDYVRAKLERLAESRADLGGGELGNLAKLPGMAEGGWTGLGGPIMSHPREFMLDEDTARRSGGRRALEAWQTGDPSLLMAALSGSRKRDQTPARSSSSSAAAPSAGAEHTVVNNFILDGKIVDQRIQKFHRDGRLELDKGV